MTTMDNLVAWFRKQFEDSLATYREKDSTCAYAAGMLLILSALKKYDGPSLPLQITAMHMALRQVGEARGWIVDRNV